MNVCVYVCVCVCVCAARERRARTREREKKNGPHKDVAALGGKERGNAQLVARDDLGCGRRGRREQAEAAQRGGADLRIDHLLQQELPHFVVSPLVF